MSFGYERNGYSGIDTDSLADSDSASGLLPLLDSDLGLEVSKQEQMHRFRPD